MKLKGYQLEFISQIKRDGSGTIDVSNKDMGYLNEETFNISSLSLTNETHIACSMSCFVVKIKPEKQ